MPPVSPTALDRILALQRTVAWAGEKRLGLLAGTGPFEADSRSCGRIESGKYWLRITKPDAQDGDGDGWHNQGSGTLTTR